MEINASCIRDGFQLNIDTTLPQHGTVAIVGPSGSGKSTLLNCIAGIEPSCKGRIHFNGCNWQSANTALPPENRNVGYVFQQGALFDFLSVKGNLAYAEKRAAKLGRTVRYQKHRLLEILGIGHLLDQMPARLSGGEVQRVAIARALLSQPDLLLLDEPLSSLDGDRKREVMTYIEGIKEELSPFMLYVSHSMEEVFRLADHCLVLEEGKLVKQGALSDVFVSNSDYRGTHHKCVVIDNCRMTADDSDDVRTLESSIGQLLVANQNIHTRDMPIRVQISAHEVAISLSPIPTSSFLNQLPARITELTENGGQISVLMAVGSGHVYADISKRSCSALGLVTGMQVVALIKGVSIVS